MHTANKTLAQILKETREAEQRHDVELAELRAKQAGPKAAANFALVRDFYRSTRDTLIQQVTERQAACHLGVRVGYDGDASAHGEVYVLLKLSEGSDQATAPSGPYYCLWHEFEQWARSEGLTAVWSYRTDREDRHGWFVLTITESAPVSRSRGAAA